MQYKLISKAKINLLDFITVIVRTRKHLLQVVRLERNLPFLLDPIQRKMGYWKEYRLYTHGSNLKQ